MNILLHLVLNRSDEFDQGQRKWNDEPFWPTGSIRAVPLDSFRSVEDGLVNFESAVETLARSSPVVEESVASAGAVELPVDLLETCAMVVLARTSIVANGIRELEARPTVHGERGGGPLPGGMSGGGPGNGKFGRAGGGGPPNKFGGGRWNGLGGC